MLPGAHSTRRVGLALSFPRKDDPVLLTTASRRPIWLGTVALSLLSAAPLLAQDPPKAEKRPFRINDLLHTPDYLKVSGEYRLRYEGLNNQFRNSTTRNNEDQIASRALLRVDYRRGAWGASVEGIDGRMWNAKGNSFADNTTVDTGDLLQAFVSYRTDNGHELTAGRWTMDLGSRRLIARNQYRNTINSFNGVRWDYENKDSGYSLADFRSIMEGVYAGVRQDESRRLAQAVQRQLFASLKGVNPALRNRGVKTAPFVVLVSSEMPAVLVEVSCLSNDEEAALLTKPLYREYIARALSSGIRDYADSLSPPAPEPEVRAAETGDPGDSRAPATTVAAFQERP